MQNGQQDFSMHNDPAQAENSVLLKVENLKTYFFLTDGIAKAVDGVSFTIPKGKTLGMVGESGCGKTVTSLSILRLIPEPPGKIVEGKILFKQTDLIKLPRKQMRSIRGNHISMIFQEPMTSLNPVFTVGDQVAEVFQVHRKIKKREALQEAIRMLELVKMPSAKDRAKEYPHQMSGGMRQRVMIAMALACNPDLLIADEPTTALDVTVQAQILELMEGLKEQFESSILIITHDLGVIAETADIVVIMYAGMIVESADVDVLFGHPLHPYTTALMKSIPRIDEIRRGKKLAVIEGNVPDPVDYPAGCRFHPRCPLMTPECVAAIPEMRELEPNHFVRCIHV